MNKNLDYIYRIANKCGFVVKHREESENTVFAFRDNDSALDCFLEVVAKNDNNIIENVAHAVFLVSENFDPHTETQQYLKQVGGKLQQYTTIYAQMVDLSWKLRNLLFSL